MKDKTITSHNKLVRDRIPEILQKKGIECVTMILSEAEMSEAIKSKLQEEVKEFLQAKDTTHQLEELADILEVIHAFLALHGLSFAQIEEIREAKCLERGGFTQNIFLQETIA